jgi:FkbM family methyltransferase
MPKREFWMKTSGMSLFHKRSVQLTVSLACFSGTVLVSFYFGARFGQVYERNRLIYELPKTENVRASVRRLVKLDRSYAQFQQDLWVATAVGQGKTDGFYVDVGSADGVSNSNTKLLDQMGWKGVCIDPFPANMQSRTCQLFRQPVFSESGKKVQFRAAGPLGGIDSDLGKYRSAVSGAPLVEFVTATLDEILEKAKAPKQIDYMNIDVEGAEYDVLRGLSLDKYEVSSFTIEHNYEGEKRELIRKLLESKGYVRVRSWESDDWYVHRNLASRYRTYLTFSTREFMF